MAQKKWAQLNEPGLGGEGLRCLVDREDQAFSIRDQCELWGLNRSTYYYTAATETEANLELMRMGYATPWDVYRGKVIVPGPDARG